MGTALRWRKRHVWIGRGGGGDIYIKGNQDLSIKALPERLTLKNLIQQHLSISRNKISFKGLIMMYTFCVCMYTFKRFNDFPKKFALFFKPNLIILS